MAKKQPIRLCSCKLRDNPDTRHAAISIYDAKEHNRYVKIRLVLMLYSFL